MADFSEDQGAENETLEPVETGPEVWTEAGGRLAGAHTCELPVILCAPSQ